MRTFVAIPLPKPITQLLVRSLAAFHTRMKAGVRWVPPENMHLTLRFLGETNASQLIDLQSRLSLLQELPRFDLSFTHYGVFPAWRSPTTIWLAFEKTSDLENLQQTVENIVTQCGFMQEKKAFAPHLTIARVKRNPSPTTIAQIKETFSEFTPPVKSGFQACDVVLFESILSPEGAKYQAIETIDLRKTQA